MRAAIWGARTLWEIEQRSSGPDAPQIFAISSVSGGSLGVADYLALLAGMPEQLRCGTSSTERQARIGYLSQHALWGDALGPLLAGLLMVDVPRGFMAPVTGIWQKIVGYAPRGGDSAEAIERGFEALWEDLPDRPAGDEKISLSDPFLTLFYNKDGNYRNGMPVWIANGTDMAAGSRLVTVPFMPPILWPLGAAHPSKRLAPWPLLAADDLLSALGADVPISTAGEQYRPISVSGARGGTELVLAIGCRRGSAA